MILVCSRQCANRQCQYFKIYYSERKLLEEQSEEEIIRNTILSIEENMFLHLFAFWKNKAHYIAKLNEEKKYIEHLNQTI